MELYKNNGQMRLGATAEELTQIICFCLWNAREKVIDEDNLERTAKSLAKGIQEGLLHDKNLFSYPFVIEQDGCLAFYEQ